MKQISVAIFGLILILLLFFFGNTIPPKKTDKDSSADQLSFKEYENIAVLSLHEDSAKVHKNLVVSLSDADKEDTVLYEKSVQQLNKFWLNNNSVAMSAYYQYEKAQLTNAIVDYELAGDGFLLTLSNSPDTLIKNNLITFALASYEAVLSQDADNLDCQYKKAKVIIEGGQDPMSGILALRSVAEANPNYIPAHLELGRLSIVSGQYDKAVDRIKHVLDLEAGNTEAVYFMAIAQEGLGNYEEAIRLFEICKAMVDNPAFSKEVNEYINKIRNKIK